MIFKNYVELTDHIISKAKKHLLPLYVLMNLTQWKLSLNLIRNS